MVSGRVTSVTGSTITVETTRFAPGTGTASASPTTTTGTGTITVTATTSYTRTVSATAAAAKVGLCATVQGSAGTTGAVRATSVALSPATGGTCTSGFGTGRG